MSFDLSKLRAPTKKEIEDLIELAKENKAVTAVAAAVGLFGLKVTFSKIFKKQNPRKPVVVRKFDDSVDAKDLVAGKLYQLCTTGVRGQKWFTLGDCLYRYSLVFMAHYWNLATTPFSYLYYTAEYNRVWYGTFSGALLTCFYPVMPFALMGLSIFKIIKEKLLNQGNWMMDGPGRVFFIKPPNPIASIIWDFYLSQSLYVGQYYLVGTNKDAIQHTWYDTILTKDFWGKTLKDVGARIPRRLGRWTGDKLEVDYEITNQNLVVKLPDSYLGIGDSFWNYGRDYNDPKELQDMLMNTYGPNGEHPSNDAIVMEYVVAKKDIFTAHQPGCSDVHSIDIVTIRTPDDDVKVLSVLLWADCTTGSSHSTQAGYTVDVETETVMDACGWYSTYFASMKTPLSGMKLSGIKRACAAAVQAHKNIKHKWLTAVGWDCMVMEDEIVFFEGNFAGARTPRRIFLSFKHYYEFITNYYWPFGKSATPGFQDFS